MRLPRLLDPVVTIEDDRGDAHILDRKGWRSSPSFKRAPTRSVITEAIRRMAPGGTPDTRIHFVLHTVAAFAILAGFMFAMSHFPGVSRIVYAVALPAAMLGLVAVSQRLTVRRSAPAGVDIMTRNGLCACCAYDLSGEPESDEPFVVCPECGAAWRRSRMTHATRTKGVGASHAPKPGSSPRLPVRRSVRDDRGRSMALLWRHPRAMVGPSCEEPRRARLEDAQREVRDLGRGFRLVVTVFCFVAAGFMALGGLLQIGKVSFGPPLGMLRAMWGPLFGLSMGAVCAWWGVAVVRGNLGVSPRVARRRMLEHALCPSCSEDLVGVAPEEDGCRVCPTCGAAWRVPEKGTAEEEGEREADALAGLPRFDAVDRVGRQ